MKKSKPWALMPKLNRLSDLNNWMRSSWLVTILVVASISVLSTANAKEFFIDADQTTILQSAKQFNLTYRSNGVAGVITAISDCYSNLSQESLLGCIALDTSAEITIPAIEREQGWPATEYFQETAYDSRIQAALIQRGFTDAAIRRQVRSQINVAADSALKGYYANERYLNGDYATALSIWTKLAQQGNSLAQTGLAAMYQTGNGVSQSYTTAAHWYLTAALRGSLAAQIAIGESYSSGQGVKKDVVQALKWLDIAWARMNGHDSSGRAQYIMQTVIKERTALLDVCSANQAKRAQSSAEQCISSEYQNCN